MPTTKIENRPLQQLMLHNNTTMSSSIDPVVAVGIDVGSSYSRVAVATAASSSESTSQARVISNTLGHFETRSMTTREQQDNDAYIHGNAALLNFGKGKEGYPKYPRNGE